MDFRSTTSVLFLPHLQYKASNLPNQRLQLRPRSAVSQRSTRANEAITRPFISFTRSHHLSIWPIALLTRLHRSNEFYKWLEGNALFEQERAYLVHDPVCAASLHNLLVLTCQRREVNRAIRRITYANFLVGSGLICQLRGQKPRNWPV
ncbi:unnamed protein product [Protopolystoma xenopodis]|uniref:Uncharacterized protein n=1 Tax=Protopolystoma xenopodis TaxID=117903 RepID=A0A448X8U9_9PLAT|nr:unnamed protein product [Protopolystoma xenopodis]